MLEEAQVTPAERTVVGVQTPRLGKKPRSSVVTCSWHLVDLDASMTLYCPPAPGVRGGSDVVAGERGGL